MNIEHAPSLLAILDDDKSVQSALQDLIESEGVSALCFDSAEQFLDSRARNQVSCLIADICMPGISGIELQARLKVEQCGMPIIFLTARGDIPLAVSAMKEGASDFFAKPFEGGKPSNKPIFSRATCPSRHESKKCCRCWSAV